MLAAAANEKMIASTVGLAKEAARFSTLDLDESSARKLDRLRLALTLPAPSDKEATAESFYSQGEGSIELSEYLLEQARIAVVPGVAFGADDHIRLSFTSSRELLTEGLQRLSSALAAKSGAGRPSRPLEARCTA